jgi:hypothetical protein
MTDAGDESPKVDRGSLRHRPRDNSRRASCLPATCQRAGDVAARDPGLSRAEEIRRGKETVAQKAHVKAGTTIAVINRVPGVVESLGLPKDVVFVKPADAQLVFLFVRTRAELEARMLPAVAALGAGSAIGVFFRKGSRNAGLDMNRDTCGPSRKSSTCGL